MALIVHVSAVISGRFETRWLSAAPTDSSDETKDGQSGHGVLDEVRLSGSVEGCGGTIATVVVGGLW